jgi:hypothetical protein
VTGFTWMNNCRTHSKGYKHAPNKYKAVSSAPSVMTSIFWGEGGEWWGGECVVMLTEPTRTSFKFRTHFWNFPKMSYIRSQAKLFYYFFPPGKLPWAVGVLI